MHSVKQLLEAGLEGKWVKVTPEEEKAIIDSIPGENLLRATSKNSHSGLRHYVDRGHIVILDMHSGDAQAHPLDVEAAKKK
jgi:hypothetical protein